MRSLLFLTIIFFACSCGQEEPDPLSLPFDKCTVIQVAAVGNGSAYASTEQGSVWYLQGGTALRVSTPGNVAINAYELIPSIGGTAYLSPAQDEGALWLLDKGVATPVHEVRSQSELDSLPEGLQPALMVTRTVFNYVQEE